MDYPDGVYLIKSIRRRLKFICYVRNGHRSAGVSLDKPITAIHAERWPYMSISETTEGFRITYVCVENFIHGIAVVNPTMTGEALLEQLGINYKVEE